MQQLVYCYSMMHIFMPVDGTHRQSSWQLATVVAAVGTGQLE